MAQLKDTTINGNLTVSDGNVYLDNGNILHGKNSSGSNRRLIQTNDQDQYFFGYGAYENNEGETYFDGNEVFLRSRGGIYITDPDAGLNERAYGQNKILWSGNWYMNGSQTASLSEAISAQPHGVVFVWSAFNASTNTSENSNFSYHFVPKSHISNFAGSGVCMHMFNSNWSKAGCKYLYINDTTAKGHNNNTLTGTGATGITYTNNYWVLRYIIGV